jgi:Holliday junction resolvase
MLKKTKCSKCHGTGYIQRRKSMYKMGRRFEYVIISYLKSRGWLTYRAYASKGVFDIVAKKCNITIGIQAKNTKTTGYLPPKDRKALESMIGVKTDYEMNVWDMQKHSVKTVNVGRIDTILHVYRDGVKKVWNELDASGVWKPYTLSV